MDCKEDINELLARYFAKEELTGTQQKVLDEWISANAEEFERMQRLMKAPVKMPDKMDFDAEQAWRKVEARLENKSFWLGVRPHIAMVISVAACVLFVVAMATTYFLHSQEDDFKEYANVGTRLKQVLLPDSSEVILYPEATLAFTPSDKEKGRIARLTGKAFFRVKRMHGMPFRVETGLLDVEVLGTSFLVNATDVKKSGVFVKTGRVRVSDRENDVVIVANEKVELKEGKLKVGVIDNPQQLFGQDKLMMIFDNTPIPEVVKEIEQKTGIRIELDKGLEKNLVTTRMDSENATEIVRELAFLCGCSYETLEEGTRYRLYNE